MLHVKSVKCQRIWILSAFSTLGFSSSICSLASAFKRELQFFFLQNHWGVILTIITIICITRWIITMKLSFRDLVVKVALVLLCRGVQGAEHPEDDHQGRLHPYLIWSSSARWSTGPTSSLSNWILISSDISPSPMSDIFTLPLAPTWHSGTSRPSVPAWFCRSQRRT